MPEADLLYTYSLFSAEQLLNSIKVFDRCETVLLTGGGAYNSFFVKQLQSMAGKEIKIVLPEPVVIDFKEAMIFAFLGFFEAE